MAIRTVVTRGYSTGSFPTQIRLVVVRGYVFTVPEGVTAGRKWLAAQGGKGVVRPMRGF